MIEASISPLLKTKLSIPQVRRERVRRTRLVDILNGGLHHPLVLVSSPAGSGKTTALVEWANQLEHPVAWISLDKGDDDPSRFLKYFASALLRILPQAGQTASEAIESPESLEINSVMAMLVNDLSEQTTDFFLILDDFHNIQAAPIHNALSFLLDHHPSCLHLVIATRTDPRFPLARLRSRDQVLELRMDQLRFNPGETFEYLIQQAGLTLSEDDLHLLQERTEGWIASLQMAALSLKNSPDSKAFIQAFSGSNRFVMDYLVEEVLDLLPGHIQAFLLQTCILDSLNGSLCDAVIGQESLSSGQVFPVRNDPGVPDPGAPAYQVLDYLERSNLFIIPLDEERKWYRYHNLFASLLRSRMAHADPPGLSLLHSRAAGWYERNSLVEEAIHHALAAHDEALAARLVENAAETMFIRGEYSRLKNWILALPRDLVHARPWLSIWYAWSATQVATVEETNRAIDLAESSIEQVAPQLFAADPAGLEAMQDEITSLRALTASFVQDYDRAVEYANRVLKKPPAKDKTASLLTRCNILHGLSSLYYVAGQFVQAEEICHETVRLALSTGCTLRLLHALNKLSYIYLVTGQLHRAHQHLQENLALLTRQGKVHFFLVSSLYCRLVDLYYEWNRLEDAEKALQQALMIIHLAESPYFFFDCSVRQALLQIVKGDFAGAQQALDEAAFLKKKGYIWPALTTVHESIQVRLWLKKGEVGRAANWMQQQPPVPCGDIPFVFELREIDRAQVYLAQEKGDEAIRLLEQVASSALAGGRQARLVEIRALHALAFQAVGDTQQAINTLENALELAQPEGFMRTFIDLDKPLVPLLSRLASEKRSSQHSHARNLLATLYLAGGKPGERYATDDYAQSSRSGSISGLVEQLSERELEVLQLMALGKTNEEIARQLVVARGTIKAHAANIYSKLDVANRTEAVSRARQLGILT